MSDAAPTIQIPTPKNITTPGLLLGWRVAVAAIVDGATGLQRPIELGRCVVAVAMGDGVKVGIERVEDIAAQLDNGAAPLAAEMREHAAAGHLTIMVQDVATGIVALNHNAGMTINAPGANA